MSSVGAAGSSTPTTLPAVQTPEAKDNQKVSTSQPDAAQNADAAKASEQHATHQLGERNLESSSLQRFLLSPSSFVAGLRRSSHAQHLRAVNKQGENGCVNGELHVIQDSPRIVASDLSSGKVASRLTRLKNLNRRKQR
jgi:hypothetical protein